MWWHVGHVLARTRLGGACLPAARASHDPHCQLDRTWWAASRGARSSSIASAGISPAPAPRPAPPPAPRPAPPRAPPRGLLAGAARHIVTVSRTSHRTRPPLPMRRRRRISTPLSRRLVSKGRAAIQDQVEKSLRRCRRCSTASTATTSQSTDRKAKETEIEKFVRERAAASSAAAGADDEDEDGPSVRQARGEVAPRLARAPPRLTRRHIGLAGYRAGHTGRAAHPGHGCRSPDSLPHAGSQPSVQRR